VRGFSYVILCGMVLTEQHSLEEEIMKKLGQMLGVCGLVSLVAAATGVALLLTALAFATSGFGAIPVVLAFAFTLATAAAWIYLTWFASDEVVEYEQAVRTMMRTVGGQQAIDEGMKRLAEAFAHSVDADEKKITEAMFNEAADAVRRAGYNAVLDYRYYVPPAVPRAMRLIETTSDVASPMQSDDTTDDAHRLSPLLREARVGKVATS